MLSTRQQHLGLGGAATVALVLVLASSSCAGPIRAPGAAKPALPSAPGPAPSAAGPGASAALELKVWARTDGSQAGPFRNGMALRANDRLYFEAQVSKQANLYFFHCNGKQELERIPAQDAIVLPIGTRHDVPEPHAYFELDENPGADVIYVVASERTLEVADPAFNDAIERARHKQAQSLDCGKERFEAIAAGKPLKEGSTGQKGVRAKQTEAPPSPVKPGPPLAAGGRKSSVRQGPPLLAAANVPPPGQSRPWQEPVPADPMADTLRGTKWKGGAGLSASRADKDGIVVLRFSFTH